MSGANAECTWRLCIRPRRSPKQARTVLSSSGSKRGQDAHTVAAQGGGTRLARERTGAASAPTLAPDIWQPRTVLSSSTVPPGSVIGRVQLTCGPEHSKGDSNIGADSAPGQAVLSSGSSYHSFADVKKPSFAPSGPRFFPTGLDSTATTRKRRKQRTCRLPADPTPAQVMRRHTKARLRLWKRLREVLIHHLFIPEDEEQTLITLAESEGVKDNEDGLEGWTAYQLMSKVSEGATDGFEILTQAVEDIISNLSSKDARHIQIRSSNVTQWRNDIQKWLQAQQDDIVLVQETHLAKDGVTSTVAAMHKAGYEMFGGEAAPSSKKGTYGGVAILSRTQFKARTVQHFTVEGCGYCAAEVRVKGVSLLLVSVYLKNATPIQCHPNAEILGRLVALVRAHVGQWIVAGDFNLTPQEMSATNLLSEMRGHLLTVGEATAHGGNEIDFAITSYSISGLVQANLDWSAPHRPHASLCIQLTMPRNTVTASRLPEFLVKEAAESLKLSDAKPTVEAVTIVNRCYGHDVITQEFASFSKWCQQAMYPAENMDRGGSLAFSRKPIVPGQPLCPHSEQAGLWLRIESWLNAKGKGGIKISHGAIQDVTSALQFPEATQDPESFRAEILALLTGTEGNPVLEARIREHIKNAQDEHLAQDKQRYHDWLEGAMVKGMRPLYKAIRAQEQILVRPFRNKEAALRPYLRHAQWQEIWQSHSNPVPTVVPELLGRAVEEAARMPALTPSQVHTRLKRLPEKAPGVEGWNNKMLKQLPPEAIEPLTQLLNHVEKTGLAPGQWSITKFTMLAKNQTIERPIGLCSVVYKAWIQMRYHLVQEWLLGYEQMAPWDSAVPGVTCLSVSIARVFKCEIAVATGRHRATLYLDLSTFYETLSHTKLIQAAKSLNFPSCVLNMALQIYRGGRIIDAEGSMGPISFTDRGVIAGCPVAPALSKLALYEPLNTVHKTGLSAGLDSWIDDVTIDAEDTDPQKAAQKIVSLYRTISAEIDNAELLISTSKSAFVCTDKQTQARLQQLLRPGEPPVLHLVKDLGVDSAGARRRRVANSNARLAKATRRSTKLTKLKVPNPKKRAQVAATGVFTAATFGHQGQGISPKRMKVLRAIAGGHYGKIAFGSLDLLFDLSWMGSGDPLCKITLEHWSMLQECVARNRPAAHLIRRTWAATWKKLSSTTHRWKLAAGPIGAMQCYLMDMGFEAPTMDEWKRTDTTIKLAWGSKQVGKEVREQLQQAMQRDRWQRIGGHEGAKGAEQGIDWTVPRRMLKESIKKPHYHAGLRMLFQGAIRRADSGGDMICPKCGQHNSLQHVLHDCIRWATVDLGPDPAWQTLFPKAPECFTMRGLVPKHATLHPPLTANQLHVEKTGVFAGEFLPEDKVYFGTDASGGPRGEDPRLRVVSWAVAAIRWHPDSTPKYTRIGLMTGSLQIGATVNDGESTALDHLAQWAECTLQVAVDSKIAIKRVQTPNINVIMPGLWSTPHSQRALLEVVWTKSHLNERQHEQRFGSTLAWAWAANAEADQACGARSLAMFSVEHAQATDAIDRATRSTCSWLGKRCAHILAHDPVPKAKNLKFEAVPVARKQVQKVGLNKRQMLVAATESDNPNTGHKWAITAQSKNLCIKCETCSLFAQQTDPIPLVEYVLSHPCRHWPASPSSEANVHPTHEVLNLGHLWSCSRCKASYSVRAPAKGRLAQPCKGGSKKKEPDDSMRRDSKSGFAALFFREANKEQEPPNKEAPVAKNLARVAQPRQNVVTPQASSSKECEAGPASKPPHHVSAPQTSDPTVRVAALCVRPPRLVAATQDSAPVEGEAAPASKPVVKDCSAGSTAQAPQQEEREPSSAGESARVSQPQRKPTGRLEGSRDKPAKSKKAAAPKPAPPGTRSVLHFFKPKP